MSSYGNIPGEYVIVVVVKEHNLREVVKKLAANEILRRWYEFETTHRNPSAPKPLPATKLTKKIHVLSTSTGPDNPSLWHRILWWAAVVHIGPTLWQMIVTVGGFGQMHCAAAVVAEGPNWQYFGCTQSWLTPWSGGQEEESKCQDRMVAAAMHILTDDGVKLIRVAI